MVHMPAIAVLVVNVPPKGVVIGCLKVASEAKFSCPEFGPCSIPPFNISAH